MKKLLFTCLLGVGSCISATSQQMLGVANSNYAGTGGIYINPASIAASPYVFYFQLSSPHLHLTNNYVHYKGSLSKAIKRVLPAEIFTTIQSNLQERLNGKPKMASLGSELRGPSFMLALSPKHSVALTTRGRGVLQLNNVSEPILRLIKNGTDKLSLQNTPYQTTFATNANAYAEIGLTYARTIFDQNAHSLKGGITVKRLYGLFSAYAISPQFNYLVRQNGDSTYLDVKSLDLQYGSSGGALGKGWGLDLGNYLRVSPSFGAVPVEQQE